MQELQQIQSSPRAQAKSAWVPLMLLIVPAVTFIIFLLFAFFIVPSSRGTLPSAPQPPWLHFCMTHQGLLVRMFGIGLVCSGLNSLGALVWLRKREAFQRTRHTRGIEPNTLYTSIGFLLITLITAGAYLYRLLCRRQVLSGQGILSGLIVDYVLPLGMLALMLGLVLLVAVTSVSTLIELFARLNRPGPIR